MNRDGSNRQQITSDDQITTLPRWSPDGRWIAYCAISTSEPVDSIKTYLIEASNLGNPRLLGRGFTQYWIDSQSLIVKTTSNSWLFFVDGKAPQRLSEDSTFAVPIFGEKHVVLQDLRKGREGWWIAATTDWRSPAMRSLKKILGPLPDSQVKLAPSRKFLLYRKNAEELWKITLPEGKAQRLPGTFPFLKSDFNVSYDGQEIIWVDRGSQSKLVMIENLFK